MKRHGRGHVALSEVVLDAGRQARQLRRDARGALRGRRPARPGTPARIILGSADVDPRARTMRACAAAGVALLSHAVLGAWALDAAARTSRRSSQETPAASLQIDHVVELSEPSEPPPPPDPEPVEPSPEPVQKPEAVAPRPPAEPAPPSPPSSEPVSEAPPPPPAQAGEVVAADDAATLDFTGFDMTTGDAPRYAGGVTASSGTNAEAVHAGDVDRDADPKAAHGAGRAQYAEPAHPTSTDWDCEWPAEADALGIDEQTVLVRVSVERSGEVSGVRVLSDPGHGFAREAARCARRMPFQAARDSDARPVRAETPPIRVRFTR